MVYVLRKRISLPAEKAIFIFVNNTCALLHAHCMCMCMCMCMDAVCALHAHRIRAGCRPPARC